MEPFEAVGSAVETLESENRELALLLEADRAAYASQAQLRDPRAGRGEARALLRPCGRDSGRAARPRQPRLRAREGQRVRRRGRSAHRARARRPGPARRAGARRRRHALPARRRVARHRRARPRRRRPRANARRRGDPRVDPRAGVRARPSWLGLARARVGRGRRGGCPNHARPAHCLRHPARGPARAGAPHRGADRGGRARRRRAGAARERVRRRDPARHGEPLVLGGTGPAAAGAGEAAGGARRPARVRPARRAVGSCEPDRLALAVARCAGALGAGGGRDARLGRPPRTSSGRGAGELRAVLAWRYGQPRWWRAATRRSTVCARPSARSRARRRGSSTPAR